MKIKEMDNTQQCKKEDNTDFKAVPPRPSGRNPYSTVAQFANHNDAFSQAAIRNLIFKAEPRESTRGSIPGNGLIEAGAIVRLGRKVLIHEERFFAWVEGQGGRK